MQPANVAPIPDRDGPQYVPPHLRPHPARATFDAHVKDNQAYFLEKYAEVGNTTEAASLSNLTVDGVGNWIRNDVQRFRERFAIARRQYAEYLESLARKRVQTPSFNGRIGSDVLLLGLLNANWPEKYRRDQVVGDDTGKEILATLKEIQQERRRARLEQQAKVVDQTGKTVEADQ